MCKKQRVEWVLTALIIIDETVGGELSTCGVMRARRGRRRGVVVMLEVIGQRSGWPCDVLRKVSAWGIGRRWALGGESLEEEFTAQMVVAAAFLCSGAIAKEQRRNG